MAISTTARHARAGRGARAGAPGGRLGSAPPPVAALAVAALAVSLSAVWLIADPRTPDLAAAVYRADLFNRLGLAVWDEHWYAGHHLPGYSLLFPPMASLLGVRVLGALAAVASAVLFERLAASAFPGRGARAAAAAWFAVAAVGDVWLGRVAFALGVTCALAAALALARGRPLLAGLLAAACAAASPVAGVLLALAALTLALRERAPRALLALAAPAAAIVLPLALLFPEGGWEPYPIRSFAATAVVVAAFLWGLPAGQRLLRDGALIYLAACVLCLLVHSPVGSNVERYGVLLAGPLLLGARMRRPAGVSAAGVTGRRGAALLVPGGALAGAVALCLSAVWTMWGPVRETLAVAGSEATSAAYYAPVERFLASVQGGPVRVEVPLTRSHWEAALLAPSVSLARGWEKQLDERYDRVLLAPGLTAASYAAWLREQAVALVALPDAQLDPSSSEEGRLIRGGLGYLREVFASRHWRVYEVLGATPLLQGPGTLRSLGNDGFTLQARSAGSFLVRVRYTRYWTLTRGAGCVREAPGGWTEVDLRAPGLATVNASFSLGRALGGAPSCGSGGAAAGSGAPEAQVPGLGTGRGVPRYRWLVNTSGAPPTIAEENRAQGTTAWRLPGAAGLIGGAAHGAVAGYVAEQAIAQGQTERVYVNAPGARTVSVRVYRMGWYGGAGGRLVLQSAPLPAMTQPRCAHSYATGLTECGWHATLAFAIPRALPSGVYVVKLHASTSAESDCMFVVRARAPTGLVVQIPTATYEAYNAWGGDGLYPGGALQVGATGSTQGVEVSYDRPYDSETGAGQFFVREVAMVRFLERYGYPASYTTDASMQGDPAQVDHARAVMDVGHSEYWSERQERAFVRARERGTSLLFVSSDTMAWRVRYEAAGAASGEAGTPDHRIVAYKQFAAHDPLPAQATGAFPLGGAQLVGSAYNGCITPRLQLPGPPVYRYYEWRPATSLRPVWLFAGTGITASTRIPGIVGYELDQRVLPTPGGTRVVGSSAGVRCMSEMEPSLFRGTVAETTLYTAASGAIVFATGTLGWLYGLSPVPQASPDAPLAPDPRVVGMTRNLLARVLGTAQGRGVSP